MAEEETSSGGQCRKGRGGSEGKLEGPNWCRTLSATEAGSYRNEHVARNDIWTAGKRVLGMDAEITAMSCSFCYVRTCKETNFSTPRSLLQKRSSKINTVHCPTVVYLHRVMAATNLSNIFHERHSSFLEVTRASTWEERFHFKFPIKSQ